MKCEHPEPRPLEGGAKWCRLCGALYVPPIKLFEALGFSGWAHPANDPSAPTMLNLIREAKAGEKGYQLTEQEGQLPVPPPVYGEKGVREVLRAWEKPDGLVVYHRVGAWNDPITWGILLGDVVRNVARAYVDKGSLVIEDDDGNREAVTQEHVEERIMTAFNAEMEEATDTPTETEFDA